MADPNLGDSSGAPAARCPWCSGALSDPDAKTCPTCGANLANEADAQLPGLTAIDLEKLAFRRTVAPRRNRLMSWISGDLDYENAADPVAPPGSLEPPPFEVRREMLRLEMAAMIADLTGRGRRAGRRRSRRPGDRSGRRRGGDPGRGRCSSAGRGAQRRRSVPGRGPAAGRCRCTRRLDRRGRRPGAGRARSVTGRAGPRRGRARDRLNDHRSPPLDAVALSPSDRRPPARHRPCRRTTRSVRSRAGAILGPCPPASIRPVRRSCASTTSGSASGASGRG